MTYSVISVGLISERAVLRMAPDFGERVAGQKDVFIELSLADARKIYENLGYCIDAIATDQSVKNSYADFLTTIPKRKKRLP